MRNKNGFSLVEGLLIILVISVIGFGGYYVWNQNQSNEPQRQESTLNPGEQSIESEPTSVVNQNSKYESFDFGFTLEYPNNLSMSDVKTHEGHEGSGTSLNFTIDNDVYVASYTSDYDFGPKGPIPLSGMVAKGYVENGDGELFYADGKSGLIADNIERRDTYLYIKNKILFAGDENPTEYIALFNTKKGGLVIYTWNPSKVHLIEKIASTVSIN